MDLSEVFRRAKAEGEALGFSKQELADYIAAEKNQAREAEEKKQKAALEAEEKKQKANRRRQQLQTRGNLKLKLKLTRDACEQRQNRSNCRESTS